MPSWRATPASSAAWLDGAFVATGEARALGARRIVPTAVTVDR